MFIIYDVILLDLIIFTKKVIGQFKSSMKIVEAPPERKAFPSRGINATPKIHMEEKVIRDSQLWGNDNTNLWIIENKLYDLKEFVSKHPGGPTWL